VASSGAGLETLQAHRSDCHDEGESLGLSLALQEAQVCYRLAQKSACLGPRTKFQQEVKCLPEQGPHLVCPMLHS